MAVALTAHEDYKETSARANNDHHGLRHPKVFHIMTIFPAPTKVYRSNTYATLSPDRPELSAASKTVLITGGGTGIGVR